MSSYIRARLALAFLASGLTMQAGLADVVSETVPGAPESAGDTPESDSQRAQAVERRVQAYSHYSTGLLYEIRQQPELALQEFTKSVMADPSHEPLVIKVTLLYFRKGDSAQALKILERAIELPDASARMYYYHGLASLENGDSAKGLASYREAILRDPTYFVPYHGLIRNLWAQDQKAEALELVDQALQVSEAPIEFVVDLTTLLKTLARGAGDLEPQVRSRLEIALERLVALNPTEPAVLELLADHLASLGKQEEAAAAYRTLLEQDSPRSALIRTKLIDIYARLDQKENLAEQLRIVIREFPTNARARYLLADVLADLGNLDDAVTHLQSARVLEPDWDFIYYELALIQLRREQPKEALEVLDMARRQFRPNFILEFYSGLAQEQIGEYSEAIRHLVEAEVLASANEPARLTYGFFFQLGVLCERNRQYSESEAYFRRCLELNPEFAEALNYLGYMWAERGENLDESYQFIVKAVELEPESAAYLDSLAWVLFQLGRVGEALPPMLKAIGLVEEPDPIMYDHLGDIYQELGKTPQAREAWAQSISSEPNEVIQKKLDRSREPDLVEP